MSARTSTSDGKTSNSLDARMRHIEQTVASIATHLDNLASSLSTVVTNVEDIKAEQARTPRPHSIREHLITAATAAAVVSGIFAGMQWWFDTSYSQHAAPLRSAVAQHKRFLDQLRDRGKLYRLFDRVDRLEEAIDWKPEVQDYDRIGRAD